MSYYVVGAIDIEDHDTYATYMQEALKALEPFDVEYLALDHAPQAIEGALPASYIMVIRFPSKDEWDKFYTSETYQNAIKFREMSSDTRFIVGLKPYVA